MPNASLELQACLLSVQKMLERLKRLDLEYDTKIRSVDSGRAAGAETLENAVSFSELRSLDLLCRDALRRILPDTHLADSWHVNDLRGLSGPRDALNEFSHKRVILEHAISMMEAAESGPSSAGE